MAQYQTADGRWIVGAVEGESDYHGFLGWRDCVIQLTASGATADSVNYLNAFRDYAFAHNALGESIMPPSVNVWISNNGTTTAVQADDISVDGNTFSIGGIKWTGSAWDYSNAGQSSGGGGGSGGGGVLVLGWDTTTYALDKTWQEIYDAMQTSIVMLVNVGAENYSVSQALAKSTGVETSSTYGNTYTVKFDFGEQPLTFATPQGGGTNSYPVLQTG